MLITISYIRNIFFLPEAPPKVTSKEAAKVAPSTIVSQNGETNEPEKQYSVLELLELQARARAIRSQLAQEPVTKIELDDSDTEITTNETPKETLATASSQNNGNHKENEPSKQTDEQSDAPKSRPVRLKRNFRQRQMEGYESDERSRSVCEAEKESVETAEPKTPEKLVEKEEPPKEETESVAPNDDDVVPIIAEPEILCISSSDSENEDKKDTNKTKRSYITMPVVEKEVRPPTEDELFLLKIKEKSEGNKKSDAMASNDPKAISQSSDTNVSDTQNSDGDTQKDEEMEDGEIVDDDEIVEIPESPEAENSEQKCDESTENKKDDDDHGESNAETSVKETEKSRETVSSGSESDSNGSESDENSGNESENSEQKSHSLASKKSNIDDDDEDIIDLGKDEDLDFEQLEMDTTRDLPQKEEAPTRRTRSKTKASKTDERSSPICSEPKVIIHLNESFFLYRALIEILFHYGGKNGFYIA